MVIYKNINKIKKLNASALTLGSYDGIHLGHMKIIKHLKSISQKKSIPSVIITFEPHPKNILSSNMDKIKILQNIDQKIECLCKMNIDYLLILTFNKKISKISAKEFLAKYIINYFNPSDIFIGNDHHFGNNQEGDTNYLNSQKTNFDYDLHIINSALYQNNSISSTVIRKYIENGDIRRANDCLGKNYELSGNIVKGEGIGTQIGFPTINIEPLSSDQIIPLNGVYFVDVFIDNLAYVGMCNIGTRPTFYEDGKQKIEVHLLNDQIPIMNKKSVKICFQKYLRAEKKYDSSQDLIIQLNVDKNQCMNMKNTN